MMSQITPEHMNQILRSRFEHIKDKLDEQRIVNKKLRQTNYILREDNKKFIIKNQELEQSQKELQQIKFLLEKEIQQKLDFQLNTKMKKILIENEKLKYQLEKLSKSEPYQEQMKQQENKLIYKNASCKYRINQSIQLDKKKLGQPSQISQHQNENIIQNQQPIDKQQVECKLFDSFFIIGSEKQEMSSENLYVIVQSSLQYQFPPSKNDQLNKLIVGNIFPFGNRTQKMDDKDDVIEIINYCNETYLKKQLQIFIIPTDVEQQIHYSNEELIRLYNPDLQLYGICISVDDFAVVNNKYVKYIKSYGFLTYFPIIELFSQILVGFITESKILRKDLNTESNEDELQDYDGFEIINLLQKKLLYNLDTIHNYKMQSESQTIDIQLENLANPIQFVIPKKELPVMIIEWSGQIVFDLFNAEQIQDIYLYLLLEQNLLFVSENQQNLSVTIQFFLNLLSPIKWVHDLTFSINEAIIDQQEIIRKPENPFIIGINQQMIYLTEYFKVNRPKENVILVYIDQENKIVFFDKKYKYEILQKIMPDIKELLKFRQALASKSVDSNSCMQIIEMFKEGMNEFLFKKIQTKYAITDDCIYNKELLKHVMNSQFEQKDLEFINILLDTKNFEAYIISKHL